MSPAPVMEVKTCNGVNEEKCCSCCKLEIISLQARVACLEKALGNILELLREKNGLSNDTLLQDSRAEEISSTTRIGTSESSKKDTSDVRKNNSVSGSCPSGTNTFSCKQDIQFEANISSSIATSKLGINDGPPKSFITETASLPRKRKCQPTILCRKRKNLSEDGTPSSTKVDQQNGTKKQASKSNPSSTGILYDKFGLCISKVPSHHNLSGHVQKIRTKSQPPKGETSIGLLDDKLGVFTSEPGKSNINLYSNADENCGTSSQFDAESSLGIHIIKVNKDLGSTVISMPEINFCKDGNGSRNEKTNDVRLSSEVQPGPSLKHHSSVPEANEKLSGSYPVIVGEPVHIDPKDFLTPVENNPAKSEPNDTPVTVVKEEAELSIMDEEEDFDYAGESVEHDYPDSERNEECSNMPASDNFTVVVGEPVHVNPDNFPTAVENDPLAFKSNDATVTSIKVKSEYVPVDKDCRIYADRNHPSFKSAFRLIKEGVTEVNDRSDSAASKGKSTSQCADQQTNVNSPKGEVSEDEASQSSFDSLSSVSYTDDDSNDDDDDNNDESSTDDSDESFEAKPSEAEELTCLLCGAQFTTNSTLKRHVQNHSLENQHSCHYCFATFALKSDLHQHLSVHLREEPLSCEEAESEEQAFSCRHCTSVFETEEQLKEHYLGTHLNERPFACTKCHAKFWTVREIAKHSVDHSKEKVYRCAHCSARLHTKQGLRVHLDTHWQEEGFVCEHCDASFKSKVDFNRHSLIARCWLLKK